MIAAPTEAVILAGGLGTRLRTIVSDVPKPLAPVAGRPFLAWVLDTLAAQGIERTILSVGYRHDQIIDTLGDRWCDMTLDYAIEAEPLGTGGAIKLAATMARGDLLFVLNGDTFLSLDYADMAKAHNTAKADITVATVTVPNISRFGGLDIRDGRIIRFLEKSGIGTSHINGGVYILSQKIFETFDLPDRFSFENNFLAPNLNKLIPLSYHTSGLFIDMGVPEDYQRAQTLFSQ